jgi:iron complex transport system ATP-binding protein
MQRPSPAAQWISCLPGSALAYCWRGRLPSAHLDPAHQLRLMELLRAEADRGTAVVVTLHDLSLASRFCDSVVVMNEGQVAGEGAAGDALTDDVLRSVFAISARRLESGIVPWQRI